MNSPRSLGQLRQAIDALDDQIVDILAERFELTQAVAQLKKKSGLPTFQPEREEAILKRAVEKGTRLGLNPLLLQALFLQIFVVSKKEQDQ